MAEPTPYTVAFGKSARTLEYRDGVRFVIFTFDLSRDAQTIFLEHHGVRDLRPTNYDEAFSRSKQFLQALGYKVEEDGVAPPSVPLTEKDAAELISALVILPIPAFVSLIDPPVRAIFEDDGDAAPWSLWLVAELKAGPHSGHKLVFDEHTRQFGVASPKSVFLGFWGSFRQTLEALCGT
jgi:hypothetical protein